VAQYRPRGASLGWGCIEESVATLRGALRGTERARVSGEGRYLDGHDCLFPELALRWRDLCAAAEIVGGSEVAPDDAVAAEAERSVRSVFLMARADGLEAAGRYSASDEMADRLVQHLGVRDG
jgi:hypothetical protein